MSYFYLQVKQVAFPLLTLIWLTISLIAKIIFYTFGVILLLSNFFDFDWYISIILPGIVICSGYLINKHIQKQLLTISYNIRKEFHQENLKLLADEIADNLNRFYDFTKWSCTILATCLVLTLKLLFSGAISTHHVKFLEFLVNHISTYVQASHLFLNILVDTMTCTLLYFLFLQMFAYQKRLLLIVLKNCSYQQPTSIRVRTPVREIPLKTIIKQFFQSFK